MGRVVKVVPMNRRDFARLVGLGSLGVGISGKSGWAEQNDFGLPTANYEKNEVYALWRYATAVYYFDPFGLRIRPGETVDFYIGSSSGRAPTIAAYHPENDNHELRIPETARPFDSGVARYQDGAPRGQREPNFRWTFEVEGTYDYYSRFEEWNGMVGRIVVGRPGGPGEKPWGYGNKDGRRPIPPAVFERAKLLDSQKIVLQRVVPFPHDKFSTPYPLW